MRVNYPYLKDSSFLFQLAREKNITLFVKMLVLTFDEKPVKEIHGRVISGNINVDGNSAVRRTGNITAFVAEKDASYMEIGGLFALNKKIRIEVGIENTTSLYTDYPILWFPQGVFCIMNLSSSHSTSGTTVSLQLKDKMVFLNGECGGTIPASTTFHEYDEIDPETGDYVTQKPTIIQIIRELVNHFGGEDLNRIIISDLDNRIKKVMKWTQENPLYHYQDNMGGAFFTLTPLSEEDARAHGRLGELEDELHQLDKKFSEEDSSNYAPSDWYQFQQDYMAERDTLLNAIQSEKDKILSTTQQNENWILFKVYSLGRDIGYVYSDFYYPAELIGNAGDSVCTILDNIKNTLGNFEYYYDLDGNFIFQEIKNYLNTRQSTHILNDDNPNKYLINRSKGKAEYVFDDNTIITSFSNSPQYEMIKNDFIVWGMRKTITDKTVPIRYHLAIDTKPTPGNTYQGYFYDDPEAINIADLQPIQKVRLPINYDSIEQLPWIGQLGTLYNVKDTQFNFNKIYYWDPDNERELTNEEKSLVKNEKILFPHHLKELPEEEEVFLEFFTTEEEKLFNREEFKKEIQLVDKNNDGVFDTYPVEYTHYFPTTLTTITTTDWRSELFMSGVNTTRYGNNSNYYYVELENEWTKLYDLEKQEWKPTTVDDMTSLDYFLDFIDSTAAISQFSISNIGRRSKIIVDDKINCIFEPEIPDFVLIESGAEDADKLREECIQRGQNFLTVDSEIYNGIIQGGTYNSAFNQIQDLLYQHTGYNEAVSVQILPMYFLEPNTRITIKDAETGIYGDYMLNSFSIPLDINGTMSLSCTRALEKI